MAKSHYKLQKPQKSVSIVIFYDQWLKIRQENLNLSSFVREAIEKHLNKVTNEQK